MPQKKPQENYSTPLPVKQARNNNSKKNNMQQVVPGCVFSVAAALALTRAPNLDGVLTDWCHYLALTLGPERCAGGSARLQHRKWVPLPQKNGAKQPKNSPKGRVLEHIWGAFGQVHHTLWPTRHARCPFGASRKVATQLLLPIWPRFGPFWARTHTCDIKTNKQKIASYLQFQGHFCP